MRKSYRNQGHWQLKYILASQHQYTIHMLLPFVGAALHICDKDRKYSSVILHVTCPVAEVQFFDHPKSRGGSSEVNAHSFQHPHIRSTSTNIMVTLSRKNTCRDSGKAPAMATLCYCPLLRVYSSCCP